MSFFHGLVNWQRGNPSLNNQAHDQNRDSQNPTPHFFPQGHHWFSTYSHYSHKWTTQWGLKWVPFGREVFGMAASLRTLINSMQNSLVRNSVGFELISPSQPTQTLPLSWGLKAYFPKSSDAWSLCEFWGW